MSRNKFIQDVVWVLILVLYPNLLNVSITIKKVKEMFGKGDTFSRKQLKHLQELSLIEWHGSNKSDPTQYYSLRKDV